VFADDDSGGDAVDDSDDLDDADDTTPNIEAARRRLARFTRRDEYERLREVAVAEHELDDDEYDRVASGAVDDDLAAVTDAISAIDAALDETAID
jgi:hypothetical protein